MLACYFVLKLLPSPARSAPVSGIREQFRYVRRGYPDDLPLFFCVLPCPVVPSFSLDQVLLDSEVGILNHKGDCTSSNHLRHMRPWHFAGPVVKLKLPSVLLSGGYPTSNSKFGFFIVRRAPSRNLLTDYLLPLLPATCLPFWPLPRDDPWSGVVAFSFTCPSPAAPGSPISR